MKRISAFRKIGILLVVTILALAMLSLTSRRPSNLGGNNGVLSPVPDSPNAVATQTGNASQKMAPIEFGNRSTRQMLQQIIEVVQSMPRTEIIKQTDKYLHVEFRSPVFRFTDDVEFLLDESAKRVHFRSASRVGYSDLGVNRKRMERITQALKNDEGLAGDSSSTIESQAEGR